LRARRPIFILFRMERSGGYRLRPAAWLHALLPWTLAALVGFVAGLLTDPPAANGMVHTGAHMLGRVIGGLLRCAPYWLMTPLVLAAQPRYRSVGAAVFGMVVFVALAELPLILIRGAHSDPLTSILAYCLVMVWGARTAYPPPA
jgi:hypothetical protein